MNAPIDLPMEHVAPAGPAAADLPQVDPDRLPSLGFFGNGPFALRVALHEPIAGLRVSIDDPVHRHLNLQALRLEHGGSTVDVRGRIERCVQSSLADEPVPRPAPSLLAGEGIHTCDERSPWWEVRFDAPIVADALVVENRQDTWSRRSRTLRVEGLDPRGAWRTLYLGCSSSQRDAVLACASRLTGEPGSRAGESGAAARARVVGALARALESRRVAPRTLPRALVMPWIPVWGREPLTEDELTVLAAIMLGEAEATGSGLVFHHFASAMPNRAEIARLVASIGRVAATHELGRWNLTRHGLTPVDLEAGQLAFVAAAERVIDWFEARGMPVMLAYGTLLGTVREGRLLPFDDDVDLLVLADAGDRAEAAAWVAALESSLRADGYETFSEREWGLNTHVVPPGSDVSIDVFPCWGRAERLSLHMARMEIGTIERSVLLPRSTVSLLGRSLPAPADPAAFLQARYGEGWRRSDPYFEWPWPLDA